MTRGGPRSNASTSRPCSGQWMEIALELRVCSASIVARCIASSIAWRSTCRRAAVPVHRAAPTPPASSSGAAVGRASQFAAAGLARLSEYDLVALHLAIQRDAVDTQLARGFGAIAAGLT